MNDVPVPATATWSSTAPNRPFAPGNLPTIPGYEFHDLLGCGGMGVVYKAWQKALKRLVAVKMIRSGVTAEPQHRARFRAEAEAVAQLHHPHIVQIYDIGEHEGQPFITLELIDGGSLAQKLAGTPQPARRAAEMLKTLAHAVEHAHQRGIVHRDLKPGNVLLTLDGQPRIADFGLAKQADTESLQTHTGAILGTPSYMAPEQALGKKDMIGPAADIYALGAILYELLTGRPPFRGESSWDTLQQALTVDPVSPRRLQPSIPRDLDTICLKCLQKEPRKRYASAAALADDLHHFLAGEPIAARPAGLGERMVKWARRRPAVAALLAMLAVLGVTSFAVITWLWLEAWSARDQTRRALISETEARRLATERADAEALARKETQRALYFSNIPLAHSEWLGYNVGQAETLLDHCSPDWIAWEWHFLKNLCHRDERTLTTPKGMKLLSVVYSPDGRYLAWSGSDSVVSIRNNESGEVVAQDRGHMDINYQLAFSPDGNWLASANGDGTVRLRDVSGTKIGPTLKHDGRAVIRIAFSPDSNRMATVSHYRSGDDDLAKQIQIWDMATGSVLSSFQAHTSRASCIAFSPNGKWLATGGTDSRLKIWDATTGELQHDLLSGNVDVYCVAFSADSKILASSGVNRQIQFWNPATGEQLRTLHGHDGLVMAIAFSHDGKMLASVSPNNEIRLWKVQTGEQISIQRGHRARIEGVSFHPDGKTLATCSHDGTVKLWDVRLPSEARTVKRFADVATVRFGPHGSRLITATERGQIYLWDALAGVITHRYQAANQGRSPGTAVALSADGQYLAASGPDNSVLVWMVEGSKEPRSLRGHQGAIAALAFSPDGRFLASGSLDKTIKLWDSRAWDEIATLKGHSKEVTALTFTKDGSRLASVSSLWGKASEIRLWDTVIHQSLADWSIHKHARSPVFSPDGRRLAVAQSEAAIIWDVSYPLSPNEEPPLVLSLRGHFSGVMAVRFSPDGNRIVTGGEDQNIRVWEADTGKPVLALRGHGNYVIDLDFSADGHLLATTSWDGSVKIWDGRPWEKNR